MDAARLELLLARLPRDVRPPRDLWPAVSDAVDPGPAMQGDLLARAPRDVTPPEAMWRHIEAAIGAGGITDPTRQTGHRYSSAIGIAAAAALLVIAVAQLVQLRHAGPPVPDATQTANASESGTNSVTVSGPDGTALLPARAIPESLTEAQRTFADELVAVRAEREALEDTLSLYPDDPLLLGLWYHVYETELRLIDDANRVMTNI